VLELAQHAKATDRRETAEPKTFENGGD